MGAHSLPSPSHIQFWGIFTQSAWVLQARGYVFALAGMIEANIWESYYDCFLFVLAILCCYFIDNFFFSWVVFLSHSGMMMEVPLFEMLIQFNQGKKTKVARGCFLSDTDWLNYNHFVKTKTFCIRAFWFHARFPQYWRDLIEATQRVPNAHFCLTKWRAVYTQRGEWVPHMRQVSLGTYTRCIPWWAALSTVLMLRISVCWGRQALHFT